MPFTASDIVPLTEARANLSELADQIKGGREDHHQGWGELWDDPC